MNPRREPPARADHERRRQSDRRSQRERRSHALSAEGWLALGWPEQRLQYLTRYLFITLGFLYFNLFFSYSSEWLSLAQMNLFLVLHTAWVSLQFIHAHIWHHSPLRYRIAMWSDILALSVVVLNDPFNVPLTALVYIVIVLGNGMRYGIRCFSEALVGSILAGTATLTLRHAGHIHEMTAGVMFLSLFGALILVYAFLLMRRVEASRQNLKQVSQRDPLTGLLNRGALLDHAPALFTHAHAHQGSVVVMFADLDKFKAINDTRGHAAGDEVLRGVADILRANIRSEDLAARYGGDEFLLVLRDLALEDAEEVARRIQSQLEAWATQHQLAVSATIGIGASPTHGQDLDALLKCVDKALYQSKLNQGSGGICHATCTA